MTTFKGARVSHRGGIVAADSLMPPPTRRAAFGDWLHGTAHNSTVNLWFIRFNTDGAVLKQGCGSETAVRVY